jgi:predicted NUDIX family NTP pyrophosphohydrolase
VSLTSAALLVYRPAPGGREFLLAHPGGPFWRRRDLGAWSVPKGGLEGDEAPLTAARREFLEETGLVVDGVFRPLAAVRQKSGKTVLCWAVEADLDIALFSPGEFEMEWPPRSGRTSRFPEIDRIAWFGLDEALVRILPAQAPLLREAAALPL